MDYHEEVTNLLIAAVAASGGKLEVDTASLDLDDKVVFIEHVSDTKTKLIVMDQDEAMTRDAELREEEHRRDEERDAAERKDA